MAYTPPPGSGTSGNGNGIVSNGNGAVVRERVKSLSYSATVNKLLLDVEVDTDEDAVKEGALGDLKIKNTGNHPAFAILAYRLWTDATTMSGNTYHLNCLLKPGEEMYVPDTPVVIADETIEQLAGTAVSNTAPDGNMYTEFSDGVADIDSATAAGIVGNATNTTVYLEPYTSAANCSANLFRVGDLIRVRNEVMEVTAIGDKSNLANNYLTVKRDMYGTDGGTSAVDNDSTRLPFFNAYHDYNKYSVAQTDSNGKFKCFNFFGLGRAATGNQGIVPGSVAIKFYEAGYQSLGLSGITSGTNSGLSVSTEYGFDITVDGSGINSDNMKFTTDSSNVNWGGTNGVISKIQAVLDTQYYTTSSPLIGKKVAVGIVGGDIRFTSGQHLSSSAMLLAAPSGGETTPFGVGAIPAIGSVRSPVAARLPDDVSYDRVTYTTSPNNVFCYDDGNGNLLGICSGTINYETGAIDMIGAPVNAEFVYSVAHTSAFSGKLAEAGTGRINGLIEILANTSNQKQTGSVALRTY